MEISQIVELLETEGRFWLENMPEDIVNQAIDVNPWFTPSDVRFSLSAIASWMQTGKLSDFLANYPIRDYSAKPCKVGLILAGNIPAAGFHDVLMTFFSGFHAEVKCSHLDSVLIPAFFDAVFPRNSSLAFKEKLSTVDAVIASGSSLTGRYLQAQFQGIPALIRGSRFSVGVLDGSENESDFQLLARDILLYNGMGCRNISHLLVPAGWNGSRLLEDALREYHQQNPPSPHFRNKVLWEQGIAEWKGIAQTANSPLCILPYTYPISVETGILGIISYSDESELESMLNQANQTLQCVIGKNQPVAPGSTQIPAIHDFADGVDTLRWLGELGEKK